MPEIGSIFVLNCCCSFRTAWKWSHQQMAPGP